MAARVKSYIELEIPKEGRKTNKEVSKKDSRRKKVEATPLEIRA